MQGKCAAKQMFDTLESRRLLAAGFQITLAYEASVASTVRTVIQQAATRWQQVITGDVPDVGSGSWGAAVDDIRITARVKSIDGAGGGVAQARPTYLRTSGNRLPIAGEIEIDSADVASQTAAGTLLTIVTHEIGHALGFGTIWSQYPGITSGLGGSNPLFLGSNALREYRSISGQSGATGVPLENTGSTGTRDAHWRESTFKTELMTGFLGAGLNPLSRITLGQFQDLGYAVNYAGADSFSMGTSAGTITGLIFNDLNRNGVKESNEGGLSGVAVYADKNWNGRYDAGEPTASANSSGVYTLGGLAAGGYDLRVVAPGGASVTSPASGKYWVTVSAGQTVSGKNFGIASGTTVTGGSVTGVVFNDTNSNGVKESSETGRSGVTLYVDTNWNNKLDAGEKSATSNASGIYSISGVNPGTYPLRILVPSGTTLVSPSNGYHSVAFTNGGAVSGRDFALRPTTTSTLGAITGNVFADANRNGRADSGESGLGGYVIFLDTNYNGVRDASEKYATSASDGTYSLTGVAAGGYNVTIVRNGATLVSPTSGAWWTNVASGATVSGKNFAIASGTTATTGSISGTVFRDSNRNSRLDSGETGLGGYVIFLDTNYNGVRDASEKYATSASNGTYSLTGVAAGGYNLTIVLGGSAIVSPSSKFWWTNVATGATVSGKNFAIA